MKRLTLIRHAHAIGKEPQSSDFDRPLSRRGHTEAESLGKQLLTQNLLPNLLMASPALRTRQTTDILTLQLTLPASVIQYADSLYLARASEILGTIQSITPAIQHLAIVGHNPGISGLARLLAADITLAELGTATFYTMNLAVTAWSEVHG